MLTSLLMATALLTTPQASADKWDLSAGHSAKTSVTWDLTVSVVQGGQDHSAAMKMVQDIKDADKDKPLKADITWKDAMLDGGQAIPDNTWTVTLDPQGAVADSDAQEGADVIKKMLTPLIFVYPTQPVAVGDTWTDTLKAGTEKDDQSIVVEMKADSMDKVDNNDALKVTETITQKGDDALKGTGTWWLDKSGKVLKFDVKVTGWVVPIAGNDPMDASFTGSLSK